MSRLKSSGGGASAWADVASSHASEAIAVTAMGLTRGMEIEQPMERRPQGVTRVADPRR